jgi:cell wall-associated NlpC family hydrolase
VGIVGFDCSSLVRYAYYQGTNGKITLPRVAAAQYDATKANTVPVDQLQPGDLLFWGSSPATIHHVALYVGGGKMLEAPQSGSKIHETVARTKGGDYLGATRILQSQAAAAVLP